MSKLGMDYIHFPVTMQTMSPEKVDEFRKRLPTFQSPVFAHCKSGKRAGAMVMIHNAVADGITGEQVLQAAKQMGFECDVPQLKEFVKGYVDQHYSQRGNG